MDLLERQPQLEELERLLNEARAGVGKLVFITGEAGAGKSTLVEHFATHCGRATRVCWGHCDALQTSRVLGPVHEVATGLSLRDGASAASGILRQQLFTGVLTQLSPSHPPAVIVLEDLHWADEATLDFVRFIGRRIQHTRCLLLATYRDDELSSTHLLRAVLGDLTGNHTARMHVPGLSFRAVEQLARGTLRTAREIYAVTNGNPFFVRELLSAPADKVPDTVRDAVLARLLKCSPASRELIELVSLIPGRVELWLGSAFHADIAPLADEAVTRGLLRYQDDSIAFRHELGRLAVESTLPRARAKALHGRILRVLVQHNADVSRLMHHALHAQDAATLVRYAPLAATQAARAGAHRAAVTHLETALHLTDTSDTRGRVRLLEQHALECNVTNQVAAALDSAQCALALWQALGDIAAQARMRVLIARQHWKAGQTALADHEVSQAIELLETLPPGSDLAMAYSARSQLAMLSKQVTETLEFARRAIDLAAQLGDHSVHTHALTNIGTALLYSGKEGGLETLQQSLAYALDHKLQEHAGRAYVNLVGSLVRRRSLGLAERYLTEGLDYCEVHDVQDCLSYIRSYAAYFDLNRGDWNQAARAAASALDRQDGAAITERLRALIVLGLVRARRGDPGADPLFEEAARLTSTLDDMERGGPVAAARAEVAWYRGDLSAVVRGATDWIARAQTQRDPWIVGELAYWARRADPRLPVPADIAEPYALMINGEWEQAAAAWERLGAPYERALALVDGPEPALRESLTILESLGAGPLAAIVRRRLRTLGVRTIPRGPRASTRKNPAGLTAREVQVLTLMVQGLTNNELARRLHVSVKTVEHHVASILQKLNVHSRTAAAVIAFERGIVRAHAAM